jgi:hypothetical protein
MKEPVTARPRPIHYLDEARGRKRWSLATRALLLAIVLGGAAVVAGIGLAGGLWFMDMTPRELARLLDQSTVDYPPVIAQAADLLASRLDREDRLAMISPKLPAALGAAPERDGSTPEGHLQTLTALPALEDAIAQAAPGDVLVLAPGHYRFDGHAIQITRPGSAVEPITIRAERLGDVVVESDATEVFKVTAPFWQFENLVIRGVCADHGQCEHAIHITGAADGTVIRNNRFEDFNAQIKVNGENGAFPDRGVIEGNTLLDTAPRATANPVTPIDLVAANDWRIRGNFVADFVRAGGAGTTYGAFVKGAGQDNVMERNLVICEWHLHAPGEHVGLSIGGGGTGEAFRRDAGLTDLEQLGGVIRDNLIVGCSDAGIYLNRAARSVIDHNTLLDTAGVQARTVETSGRVTANIVDGVIRARGGATLEGWDNDTAPLLGLYIGSHPQRAYFRGPASLDLAWRAEPGPVSEASKQVDLCGVARTPLAPPGAFADYKACLGAGQ